MFIKRKCKMTNKEKMQHIIALCEEYKIRCEMQQNIEVALPHQLAVDNIEVLAEQTVRNIETFVDANSENIVHIPFHNSLQDFLKATEYDLQAPPPSFYSDILDEIQTDNEPIIKKVLHVRKLEIK